MLTFFLFINPDLHSNEWFSLYFNLVQIVDSILIIRELNFAKIELDRYTYTNNKQKESRKYVVCASFTEVCNFSISLCCTV